MLLGPSQRVNFMRCTPPVHNFVSAGRPRDRLLQLLFHQTCSEHTLLHMHVVCTKRTSRHSMYVSADEDNKILYTDTGCFLNKYLYIIYTAYHTLVKEYRLK